MDGFQAKIYPLVTSNPAWLTYVDLTGSWDAEIPNDLTAIAGLHGDFEFVTKASKTHIDDDGNTVVDSEVVTGKATVSLEASTVSGFITNYAGVEKSFIVHSADLATGEYFHEVVMNFVETGKIGELITGELSFEYTNSTNTAGENARRRRFAAV